MALPYLNANPAIDLKLTMVDGVIEFMEASSDEPSGALLSAVRTAHHMLLSPLILP
jgi:auxin responsive GH3 family protein